MDNHCIMQYFEWDIPADGLLWRRVGAQAASLKAFGIDSVWLPPAYKGAAGGYDVGYGVYDLYDLGEFDQKGTVRTKYGTRDEYLACIRALQEQGIRVLADIVLNHRLGADETELVQAEQYDPENRLNRITGEETISAWTKYTFPGRGKKYSDFQWNWTCFNGIDWDNRTNQGGLYQFKGKDWNEDVDKDKGNFDYLMGANVDMKNPAVVEELIRWGKWYQDTTGIDGFRLDAIKHIDFSFYEKWLDAVRKHEGEDSFAMGEYWSGDVDVLKEYLQNCGNRMSLFDVPLHFNFYNASRSGGNYDMRKLFDDTLVQANIFKAVTFVDNHDSQPGQSLESWVEPWFKPLAYAAVLLRRDGLPCVFYADYYGLRKEGVPPVIDLKVMLAVRRDCAYGTQHDYFDHESVVGWTREGDEEHPNSGCAVLMSDAQGGEKTMYVGQRFAGQAFLDATRRSPDVITIDETGSGKFNVPGGSVTVWVNEAAYADIVIHCE